jgi:sulfhydrogenase subunit delta
MAERATKETLRVGVIKFASCDGCQLAFLGLGPALLSMGVAFSIIEFAEVSSRRTPDGPFDILFVEGSVSNEEQLRHLRKLRSLTSSLVTIGACATSGGIQALRNWAARSSGFEEVVGSVYADPRLIESLDQATPIAKHVTVDAELRGCPIDARQLMELLTAVATGRRPQLPDEAVCVACKRAGRVCVMVARGEPCLGPIIHAGCGALCPAYARGCYGCFGPRENANGASLADWFGGQLERSDEEVAARFAGFTAWSPELRGVIDRHGGPPGFGSGLTDDGNPGSER